ncbi:MAG: CDP-diacylglycerol--glycerol-3-phosphate 3-phosphatidyltransferase [Bacilli bacterium]
MNLPNKITVARMVLIPLFLILYLAPLDWGVLQYGDYTLPISQAVAAFLFIFAALTDWIDGYYARKLNLVTNLGKFLDPLADKLLVAAALIALVETGDVAGWIVIVIISREFAVTGIRLLAVESGSVLAADMLGKIKTTFQLISISLYLIGDFPFVLVGLPVAEWTMWIAVFFTIVSGWNYFWKNRHLFVNSK